MDVVTPFGQITLVLGFFSGSKSTRLRLGFICVILAPPSNCGIYWRVEMDVVTPFGQMTLTNPFFVTVAPKIAESAREIVGIIRRAQKSNFG